ncbi:MAG TPA: NTF2-like N-terminal transpeptidase domain-containing protein, partial [Chloroflexota bacterium]|nr:NTF2-like N-terminal transpeptidase domain-containing protein [Chloroflexota bacterium]
MAYRRRRQRGSPWPTFLVTLVVLLVGGYVFRHAIESEGGRLAERAAAVIEHRPTVNLSPDATPTFTVVVDSPIPLGNVPAPELTASHFLDAWSAGNYQQMYAMLSKEAQGAQTQQKFIQWYTDLTKEATITGISTHITSIPTLPPGAGNGASVQVPFTVEFKTIRVGTFQENNSVPLVLEDGQWRVDWQPSLFFSGLAPNDTVRLFPLDPRRGSILDRKGRPLAMMGFQETIGVVPSDLAKGGHEDQTLQIISQYLKKSPADLKKIYANQPPDWFIPLGDVSGSLENELHQKLDPLPGVSLRRKPIRVYPQGEVASHIVGYVGHITEDELKTLKDKGYTIDDIVGRAGVEQWADSILAGQRGGKLAVVAPTGEVVRSIAQRDAVPGDDVVLSIDLDIQKEAEQVLGKLDGSVIVMNPQDNSVLAMASYPNFDPNKFVTGFTPQEWQAMNSSPDKPFLNRPTEAAYPTGSIFKVITATAG